MKNQPIWYALLSAFLYALATPSSKLILKHIDPTLLAGLLYLSAGIGLTCISTVNNWFAGKRKMEYVLDRRDWIWFTGAVVFGGILAPLCLMAAMSMSRASSISLLFNLEIVFAVFIATLAFGEHLSSRSTIGLIAILLGSINLCWNGYVSITGTSFLWMSLACLFWAIDSNITSQMKNSNPVQIAQWRGLIAGTFNLAMGLALGHPLPSIEILGYVFGIGALSYGIGLSLYIIALHNIGTARTTALFATEPFMGALLSVVLLHEPFTISLGFATALMGFGVWLHISEAI